jgi:hypothetical protein
VGMLCLFCVCQLAQGDVACSWPQLGSLAMLLLWSTLGVVPPTCLTSSRHKQPRKGLQEQPQSMSLAAVPALPTPS